MSWGEVYKINSNFSKSLNEQMRDNRFMAVSLFTSSGTWKPTKKGWYKVVCVGAPGALYKNISGNNKSYTVQIGIGGSGAVAIKDYKIDNTSTSYSFTINSTATTFNSSLIAGAGSQTSSSSSIGKGGTASGGDFNYNGLAGYWNDTYLNAENYTTQTKDGIDVGVYIPELHTTPLTASTAVSYGYLNAESARSNTIETNSFNVTATAGRGILGYGASQGFAAALATAYEYGKYAYVTAGKSTGAVIIIPLEFEE